jgi:hypothetical protein
VCVREILTSQPTGSRESISHRIWDFVTREESWGGEKCGLGGGCRWAVLWDRGWGGVACNRRDARSPLGATLGLRRSCVFIECGTWGKESKKISPRSARSARKWEGRSLESLGAPGSSLARFGAGNDELGTTCICPQITQIFTAQHSRNRRRRSCSQIPQMVADGN